jgi:hypothetical protein
MLPGVQGLFGLHSVKDQILNDMDNLNNHMAKAKL